MQTRPSASEHAPFYAGYVALVPEVDVMGVLESQARDVDGLLRSIPDAHVGVLHPPYTWTIRQVVGHLIDGERIFAYRALRIARGDATPLPGFDENTYARSGEFDRLALPQLADEFAAVRRSTVLLFRHLPATAWSRAGTANGSPITVRASAFIIAGHVRHHLAIIRKRLAALTSS
jgi:hypothetical protein